MLVYESRRETGKSPSSKNYPGLISTPLVEVRNPTNPPDKTPTSPLVTRPRRSRVAHDPSDKRYVDSTRSRTRTGGRPREGGKRDPTSTSTSVWTEGRETARRVSGYINLSKTPVVGPGGKVETDCHPLTPFSRIPVTPGLTRPCTSRWMGTGVFTLSDWSLRFSHRGTSRLSRDREVRARSRRVNVDPRDSFESEGV